MKTKIFTLVALFITQTTMAQSVNVIERDGLRLHVFLSKPVIFQVASVVIEGPDEVPWSMRSSRRTTLWRWPD